VEGIGGRVLMHRGREEIGTSGSRGRGNPGWGAGELAIQLGEGMMVASRSHGL
jgi:hypothetical protein